MHSIVLVCNFLLLNFTSILEQMTCWFAINCTIAHDVDLKQFILQCWMYLMYMVHTRRLHSFHNTAMLLSLFNTILLLILHVCIINNHTQAFIPNLLNKKRTAWFHCKLRFPGVRCTIAMVLWKLNESFFNLENFSSWNLLYKKETLFYKAACVICVFFFVLARLPLCICNVWLNRLC